tara:strand:+ start:8315 stop:9295 length:981 start_codon:yes stop_codon:yes gene_type:complete
MMLNKNSSENSSIIDTPFFEDVLHGLSQKEKQLPSKYFYNKKGDLLFQQIMHCDDYYLTRCEMDIFQHKTAELSKPLISANTTFDLIELGAGDGSKTKHLLQHLIDKNVDFNYKPIDISGHILSVLKNDLQENIPQLNTQPEQGDYFEALARICATSDKRKVILFLGSNIGNMLESESISFCSTLAKMLSPGDLVLIGFDLKKLPATILSAYNDKEGLTAQFNLNLLQRINNELGANFDPSLFMHYPTYNPQTGACKSYLISLKQQDVQIDEHTISFDKHEPIFMEVSRKFSMEDIRKLAHKTGFKPVSFCMDTQEWFTDVIWEVC